MTPPNHTPLTDEELDLAIQRNGPLGWTHRLVAEVRRLRVESEELRAANAHLRCQPMCACNCGECIPAPVAMVLQRDAERLDWILDALMQEGTRWPNTRSEIDAAMAREREKPQP